MKRAYKQGWCDALLNRPSRNPYTFNELHRMNAYNDGYYEGKLRANELGIVYAT